MAEYHYEAPTKKNKKPKKHQTELSEIGKRERRNAIIICLVISVVLVGVAIWLNIMADMNNAAARP